MLSSSSLDGIMFVCLKASECFFTVYCLVRNYWWLDKTEKQELLTPMPKVFHTAVIWVLSLGILYGVVSSIVCFWCSVCMVICVISSEHLILSSVPLHHVYDSWWLCKFFTNKTKTISSQFSPPLTQDPQPTRSTDSNSHLLLLSPHRGGSIQTSPLQPSYKMSSRPYPLTPSPSYLSHTLSSTHTHHQHISPHRHLPHCIQAGSGNPTAQKTYIKHFTYR